jgi:hypothetical protein
LKQNGEKALGIETRHSRNWDSVAMSIKQRLETSVERPWLAARHFIQQRETANATEDPTRCGISKMR